MRVYDLTVQFFIVIILKGVISVHIALYRKYRSATFSDVCGQEQVTSVLKYQAANGKLSHAYLFCGSRGTGKTSCAKILAKAVNCESPKDGEPCGECRACNLIDSGAATDVMEMDAASETGVDYIRSIREEVQYSPLALKKRVYIIDEVHMLSESAFNALLKTLEEPPEHVVFILATTEMHKIPATVISRCQRFDFRRLPVDVIVSRLEYIAGREGITLEAGGAKLIAKQAQGGMRDAISLFELCAGGGAEVTESRVKDILGIGGYEGSAKAASAIAKKDMKALFDIVSSVVASSKDISVFWQELTVFYRDMLIFKYTEDAAAYLDLTVSEHAVLKDSSEMFQTADLFYQSKILDDAFKDMVRMPETKRITAELAFMRMCDPSLSPSSEALTARIEALENTVALLSHGEMPVRKTASDNVEKKSDGEGSAEKTSQKSETVEAAPDTPLEKTVGQAALPSDGAADTFVPFPDLSEVAEKVGKTDPMCRSILAESTAEISEDGGEVRIVTANPFAPIYLVDDLKRKIAETFMLCKITDRIPKVEVVIRDKKKKSSPSDELFI